MREPRGHRIVICGLSWLATAAGCGDSLSMSIKTSGGSETRITAHGGVTRAIYAESHEDAQIRAALSRPAELSFQAVELDLALTSIADKYQVPLRIDRRAWDNYSIDPKQLVDADDLRAPLGRALTAFLKPYQLAYGVRDGLLWITTLQTIGEYTNQRVYPVDDLLITPNDPAAQQLNFDRLIEVITSSIDQPSWQFNGGVEGSILGFEGTGVMALVVSHRDDVHEQVTSLLTNLRQARSSAAQAAQGKRPLVTAPAESTEQHGGGFSGGGFIGSGPF